MLKPQDFGLRPFFNASPRTSSHRRITSQVPLTLTVAEAFTFNSCLPPLCKLLVSVLLVPPAAPAALVAIVLRSQSSVQSQAGSNVLYERDMGRQVLERAQGNIISSKPFISHSNEAPAQRGLLAHELIQGPLVRFSRTAW